MPPKATADASSSTKKLVFGKDVEVDIPADRFPTLEEIEKHEACMVGCVHGWMESCHRETKNPARRFQLHHRSFLPTTASKPPKAIVIWFHGIQSHSGEAFQTSLPSETTDGTTTTTTTEEETAKLNMALLAEQFVHQQGCALYAMDMLGHGFSEGTRFYVKDWTESRSDAIQFVEYAASQHAPNTPVFVGGHSFGGCLALHVAHAYQQAKDTPTATSPLTLKANVDSVIAIAPAIIGDLPPYPVVCLLRYVLAPMYPLWVPFFMPNPVSADHIWKHPQTLALHSKTNAEYPLDGSGKPFRLGTAVQLLLALEACRRIIPQFRLPFCVLHGMEDHAVPMSGTDFLEAKVATPSTDRVIYRMEGAYHDLLGDWPSSKLSVPHMVEWIQRRLEQ